MKPPKTTFRPPIRASQSVKKEDGANIRGYFYNQEFSKCIGGATNGQLDLLTCKNNDLNQVSIIGAHGYQVVCSVLINPFLINL